MEAIAVFYAIRSLAGWCQYYLNSSVHDKNGASDPQRQLRTQAIPTNMFGCVMSLASVLNIIVFLVSQLDVGMKGTQCGYLKVPYILPQLDVCGKQVGGHH